MTSLLHPHSRYDTVATGVVFFHRFFMLQSFKQFDRWVVAAACLLLAGKVEETPKKCKDILKVTNSLLNSQQMAQFGSNPKEELLTHERILLQTIKFDLQLEHPYSYLLKFAKGLRGEVVVLQSGKEPERGREEMNKKGWLFTKVLAESLMVHYLWVVFIIWFGCLDCRR